MLLLPPLSSSNLLVSVVSDSVHPHGLKPVRLLRPWGYSRQEYCTGLPCHPPGDLPDPGIEPRSPTWQVDSLPSEPPGKPWSLLIFMSIKSVMLSNHLILCHLLLLLPSVITSIRVFFSESALCIRCPMDWSFSFSNSPSNEYSGLISFRIDWVDLLAVQETLKSFLQHHSMKASNLLYGPTLTSVHD